MSGIFWTKQAQTMISSDPPSVLRNRRLILTGLAVLSFLTVTLLAAFSPDFLRFAEARTAVNITIVMTAASAIMLYLRFGVTRAKKRLYLPITFSLTCIASVAYFVTAQIVTTDPLALLIYRTWNLYVLHTVFSVLLFISAYVETDQNAEKNSINVPWFLAFGIVLFSAAAGLIWAGDAPPGYAWSIFKRLEELAPLAVSLLTMAIVIKRKSWQRDQIGFALLIMSSLSFVAALHMVFASNYGHPLEIAGYGYVAVALAWPFFSILRSMMHAYLNAEQYKLKEQLASKNLLQGQNLSPLIFREIAQQLNEAFAITDVTGRIIFVNKHLVKMTGFDEQRLINNTPALWQHESVPRDFYSQLFSKIRAEKKMYEGTVHNAYPANRQKGYVAGVRVTPVLNEFGEIAVCVLQQRSLTQEQEQLKLLRQILDTMPLGVLLFDTPELTVTLGNQQAEVLLSRAGYDFRAVKNFKDVISRFKKKDGTPYPAAELPPMKTLKTQKRSEASDIAMFLPGDSKPSMIWKMTAVPFFNEDGTARAILIDFDDVTRHLEYEHKMTDFISVASHQLRTPLTSIKWSLDALRKKNSTMAEQDKLALFDTCYQAAQRMMMTIQQLLKVAELEREDANIESRAMQFGDVVKESVTSLNSTIEAKKLTFKETVLHSLPLIHYSPFYLTQIVHNVLENAVKYTPDGGEIDSILNVIGGRIEWTLHDTGIGIPKKDLEKIFEKFHRSDNAQRMVPDGTGLGLYIVKRTIDLCGGTIRIASEEGRGTTVVVSLPLVQKNATPTPTSKTDAVAMASISATSASTSTALPTPLAAQSAVPAQRGDTVPEKTDRSENASSDLAE